MCRTLNIPHNFSEFVYRLVRGILYAFTFILCVLGLSMIIFSFWYIYEGKNYHLDIKIKTWVFSISFLTGLILFVLSVFGLTGVLRESLFLTKTVSDKKLLKKNFFFLIFFFKIVSCWDEPAGVEWAGVYIFNILLSSAHSGPCECVISKADHSLHGGRWCTWPSGQDPVRNEMLRHQLRKRLESQLVLQLLIGQFVCLLRSTFMLLQF